MSALHASLDLPPEFTVLSGDPQSELGNLVLREEGQGRILKVYRMRRGKARDALSLFSGVFMERKRPVDALGRRRTEEDTIRLWEAEGFRVPCVLEGQPPEWLGGHPFLWIEDTPGPPLLWALADPEVPWARKEAWLRALGAATQRRERRALELREPLLIQEHPTLKHVLVHGEDDLVTIDLENGFRSGYSLLYAIAYELAGMVRSIPPVEGREEMERIFLEAMGDRELIVEACQSYYSWTPVRTARRWSDRLRRDRSKTAVVDRLAEFAATGR